MNDHLWVRTPPRVITHPSRYVCFVGSRTTVVCTWVPGKYVQYQVLVSTSDQHALQQQRRCDMRRRCVKQHQACMHDTKSAKMRQKKIDHHNIMMKNIISLE